MNNDERILLNQKLIQENAKPSSCRGCIHFKESKCTMYIPDESKCLILLKYYNYVQ